MFFWFWTKRNSLDSGVLSPWYSFEYSWVSVNIACILLIVFSIAFDLNWLPIARQSEERQVNLRFRKNLLESWDCLFAKPLEHHRQICD